MKIEVVYSRWGYDGGELEGGVQEIEKPSKKLLAQIGAAVDAGVLVVKSASKDERAAMTKAVQSQEDGEKAYYAAQESGAWHEGNVRARFASLHDALAVHEEAVENGVAEGRMSERNLALTRFAHKQTGEILIKIDDGASFEEAAQAWHDERAEADAARARAGER